MQMSFGFVLVFVVYEIERTRPIKKKEEGKKDYSSEKSYQHEAEHTTVGKHHQ